MNWQVVSQVHGGHQSSPATVEEFESVAAALADAGARLASQARVWDEASLDIGSRRYSVPLCTTLSSGTPHTAQAGHVTLPYARLIAACKRRAEELRNASRELTELSGLVASVNNRYADAERLVRDGVDRTVQTATQLFPLFTTGIMVQMAAAGLLGSWIVEGKPNPAAASLATAPFQQGYISGIGSNLVGVSVGLGLFLDNEVNLAATKVGSVSKPFKDLLQGDELHLKRVEPFNDVVLESKSVSDSLENLRRLAEERLGKIDLHSGLTYATIAVQRYERADGTNAWLVTVPGTDGIDDSPFGWAQNVELMSNVRHRRRNADSARMVVEAMERAGIGRDDPVAIVGHSQGGIVAAAIASDESERFNIQHVVTAGSPIANHPIPSKTWVTSIEIKDELVASLDGADNPATEQWMTVQGTVMPSGGAKGPTLNEDGSCSPDGGWNVAGGTPYAGAVVNDPAQVRELSHWLKYHQAAYQNASDKGSHAVVTHEEHFAGVIAGELKETQYYEGRMSMFGDQGVTTRPNRVSSGEIMPADGR